MQELESRNPADGSLVGSVAVTSPDRIPEIVDAARVGQRAWAALRPEERAGRLCQAADVLADKAEELGTLLSREMGKPLRAGIGEVRGVARSMASKTEAALAALEPVVHRNDKVETTVHQDPRGVVAVISPWNYPMAMPHWMMVPALMAGNAVVLKPSEETPLTAQAYADALIGVLPENVVQVVHGADAQGKELVAADVDMVTFTGSRRVGIAIMRSAADGLKRLVLELGGKDPLIVLDDADLEAAVAFAAQNSFDNAGQMCVSTERIFVDHRLAEAFEEELCAKTRALRFGPYDEEGVQIGPMIHEEQRRHVLDQIDDAIRRGASRLEGPATHPDRYVVPTVLGNVTSDMRIGAEETFGPVACVTRFDDVDWAVAEANAGPYGLGAAVFGRDENRALAVARRLEAGMIGVNRSLFGAGDTPWVGAKQSGFGFHGSPDGTRQFAQPRVLSVAR